MRNAVGRVAELLRGKIDAEPTIRPVLNLTNVNSGIAQIDGALMASRSLNLGMDVVYRNQNGSNSGLDDLASRIADANSQSNSRIVDAIQDLKNDFAEMIERFSQLQVVMDTGTLVGAITPEMDRSLGVAAVMNRRGNL